MNIEEQKKYRRAAYEKWKATHNEVEEGKKARARKKEKQRKIKELTLDTSQNRFKRALAKGFSVEQAVQMGWPKLVSETQQNNKIEQLRENPIVGPLIDLSIQRYALAIINATKGEHPLEYLAKNQVEVINDTKGKKTAPMLSVKLSSLRDIAKSLSFEVKREESKSFSLSRELTEDEYGDMLRIQKKKKNGSL